MTIRNLNSTLRTSLLDNDPFNYCHLVKFEKPTNSIKDGKTSFINSLIPILQMVLLISFGMMAVRMLKGTLMAFRLIMQTNSEK